MGMIGVYARVSPAGLRQILDDPGSGRRIVDDAGHMLDVDKAWNAIAFFLERLGVEVDVVYGEDEVTGAPDWGFGPPRYLEPARVRAAAEALARIDGAALTGAATRQELFDADVYPAVIWTRDEEALAYVRSYYDDLVTFMTTASRAGDAVFMWIG